MMKKSSSPHSVAPLWIRAVFTVLVLLSCPNNGQAKEKEESPRGPNFWREVWGTCYDVHTPKFDERLEEFQKLLVDGFAWDLSVDKEISDLDFLVKKTCVAWAADPNSSTHLTEFRKKYAQVSNQALDINAKANDYLLAKLKLWTSLQEAELAEFQSFPSGEHDVTWDQFPCSASFKSAQEHVQKMKKTVTDKFKEIQEKCPRAADNLPTNTTKTSYGQGSVEQKPVPAGTSPKQKSDIVGTEKAIQDNEKAKAKINKK